jgi:hypothetical protein
VTTFENGALQGWEPAPGLGQVFQLTPSNFGDGAGEGQFAANAAVQIQAAPRRVGLRLPLCAILATGARGTTDLVGQTVSALVMAGSQGGVPAGALFRLSLADASGVEVTLATLDASTNGVGQQTGWRSLSAPVPDNVTARQASFAIISLELGGMVIFGGSLAIDNVQVGD